MPNIPQAQRQVEIGALPAARTTVDAPLEAFGGGQSAQTLAQSGKQLATTAFDIYKEAKQKADESYVTGLDLEASKEQTRIEVAIKNMRGRDSIHAADYAKDEWAKVSEKLQGNNAYQSQVIGKLLSARYGQIDRTAQTHTGDEMYKADEQQSNSYIAAEGDSALLHFDDPSRVAQSLDNQKAEIERVGARLGWDANTIEVKKRDTGSLTLAAIVGRKLDNGDYKGAQSFFDTNKESFAAHDVGHVEKSLEDGKVLTLGKEAYASMGGFKLSNGAPDLARMESSIESNPNYGDREREKILTFVKAKAGDDWRNKLAQDNARDETFKNSAINAKKNGQPLEQSLLLAGKYSDGSYNQAVKEDFVRALYAPPDIKDDPAARNALADAIDAGTGTSEQIDLAYKQGKITAGTNIALHSQWHNVVIEGKSPEMQRANEQIKMMAKARFGSDHDAIDAYVSEVKSSSFLKSPKERIKIADDLLKEDKSTASRFPTWLPEWTSSVSLGVVGPGKEVPFFGGDPQYKTNEARTHANDLALGNFHQDLGVDAVNAIGRGAIMSGAKGSDGKPLSPGAAVDSISTAFGGYDNVKKGTPVNNAINSLSKAGIAVSVDAIQKVLEHHPDGIFALNGNAPAPHKVAKVPRGKF